MKRTLEIISAYLPAILLMAVIFYFSAQTGEESTLLSDEVVGAAYGEDMIGTRFLTVIVRKGAHFAEYALLGGLIYLANRRVMSEARDGIRVLSALGASAVYALSDEIHQYFVPGRACMASDVLIDSLGALFGIMLLKIIFAVINKFKNERKK